MADSTDWGQHSIWSIWAMLAPESRANGEIATAMWSRMRTVCEEEADQIELALSKLAQAWPPPQPAAVAFQEMGSQLVAAMRSTAYTALRNGPIVDSITTAIAAARDHVHSLVSEANELREIEARNGVEEANQLYAARHGGESTTWWRNGLDGQAQQIMANLENVIVRDTAFIRPEKPFDLQVGGHWEDPPTEPGRVGTEGNSLLRGSDALAPTGWGGMASPGGGEIGFPGSGATQLDGEFPGPGSAPVRNVGGTWPSGSFVDTPAGSVLAPGGQIGAPGTGNAAGAPLVPGVIAAVPAPGILPATSAGAGVAARTSGSAIAPMVPPVAGQPGAADAKAGNGSPRRRRGLPSVFETTEGPPAVIVPPEEPQVHYPGPGVIGIDR
ncbi:MAG TPA: hypothetical protein VH561_05165 [Micromonosporaceae bacterium]